MSSVGSSDKRSDDVGSVIERSECMEHGDGEERQHGDDRPDSPHPTEDQKHGPKRGLEQCHAKYFELVKEYTADDGDCDGCGGEVVEERREGGLTPDVTEGQQTTDDDRLEEPLVVGPRVGASSFDRFRRLFRRE